MCFSEGANKDPEELGTGNLSRLAALMKQRQDNGQVKLTNQHGKVYNDGDED